MTAGRIDIPGFIRKIDPRADVNVLRKFYIHGANLVNLVGTLVANPKVSPVGDGEKCNLFLIIAGEDESGNIWITPAKMRSVTPESAKRVIEAANLVAGQHVALTGSFSSRTRKAVNIPDRVIERGSLVIRWIQNVTSTYDSQATVEKSGVKILNNMASQNDATFTGHIMNLGYGEKTGESKKYPVHGTIIIPDTRFFDPKIKTVQNGDTMIEVGASISQDNVIPFMAETSALGCLPIDYFSQMDIITATGKIIGKPSTREERMLGYGTHREMFIPKSIRMMRHKG